LQSSANVNIETVSSVRRHGEDAVPVVRDDYSIDDHEYLPSMISLSQFVDNVVIYMAGYFVKSLEAHIACEPGHDSMIDVKSAGQCLSLRFWPFAVMISRRTD